MSISTLRAGVDYPCPLSSSRLEPTVPSEVMLEHMRSALSRRLPEVRICREHRLKMCVLAGGPSLADTVEYRDGYLAAVNGSLRWLLERGIVPNACGILDPGAHMADVVEARPGVNYFVASICHPSVFDKLAGCHVVLWHPSGQGPGTEDLLKTLKPDNWLAIGGGCTMGVRWINLAYVMGFRSFDLHGLDSSFRDGATHAYADRADGKPHLTVGGRETRLNLIAQIQDFFAVLDRFGQNDMAPTTTEVFGDGLLQDAVDGRLRERGELFGVRATLRRNLGGGGGAASIPAT